MQVAITARHTHLTQPMKEHVEERVRRLERLLDPSVSANVVLLVEKYRQAAEITLRGNGVSFHGRDVANDLVVAIDNAVEKVRRQIEKHKDRIKLERIRENQRQSEAAKSHLKAEGEPGEKPLLDAEAASHPRLGEAPPVMKTSHVPYKPMSVEEATLQLCSNDYQFFVFRNALTDEINVVYLQGDGQIGLIAPAQT